MPNDPQPRSSRLRVVSLVFLVVAIAELVMVVVVPAGGGANIGLPIALVGVLAAAAALGITALAPRAGLPANLVAILALVVAGMAMLFVAAGILEETP